MELCTGTTSERGYMKLKHLWFEVTRNCNSRCSYCQVWKNTKQTQQITPSELGATLKTPLFQRVEYIINSGGEPTCEAKLLSYLQEEHAALPKARLQLSTNGLLPTTMIEVATAMLNEGAKLDVGISLDGVGADHDIIRGVKGNFEKVDRLLQELPKYSNVTVGATLTDQTLKPNFDALRYASERNIPFMFHWLNTSEFYENTKTEYTTKSICEAVLQLPASLYRDLWVRSLLGNTQRLRCKALQDFAIIRNNGDVVPCLTLWNQPVGNIGNRPIINAGQLVQAKKLVKACVGCLNNWAVSWSLQSYPLKYPVYWWKLKQILREKFRKREEYDKLKIPNLKDFDFEYVESRRMNRSTKCKGER